MNRKTFERLPLQAQAIIRKNSAKHFAERSAADFEALDKATLMQLQSDARREVIFPSTSDLETARHVFTSVIDDWAAQTPHNRELLALARAEIAKLRSSP